MPLTTMQEMSIWSSGKCRCSYCGKFRKESDFPDQPSREYFTDRTGNIFGSYGIDPACSSCLPSIKEAFTKLQAYKQKMQERLNSTQEEK
jgi:hypothetical protein